MILLDSSVWIDHLTGGSRLPDSTDLFARVDEIVVSSINLFEVGRYVARTGGFDTMEEILAHMSHCRVVPVDAEIAARAVVLAATYSLHMADAIVAATAERTGAELISFGQDLLRLPGAKKPS